ncbi:MAG TPA: alanine dehydrogenase [Firmicutes bacterium]|nr:alanine dehydrogenase [Bacillota bacterium]HHY98337.1 alanine dehydrogenase [Bacillota bacterium]
MIVGVPKEIKEYEYRVALAPSGAEALMEAGHEVLIEKGAGLGSGIEDKQYEAVGAKIVPDRRELFQRAEMIVKIKEPLPEEYDLFREGQLVFTYFHFAADRALLEAMLEKKIIGIAYETVRENGSLPLLTPMSEVAGRMSVHEAAKCLESPSKGAGVLLAGVPGVAPANVVVLGGGSVGANAARLAAGLGANVFLLDVNLQRLRYLDEVMPENVTTLFSNKQAIGEILRIADVVIGAVLLPGRRAPKLITRDMLDLMKPGSVIIDVCIDQGGCAETSRPTTHGNPTYVEAGVVHYCVTNMPGAVGRTSTYALTNATFPYVLELANKGFEQAISENKALREGVNVYRGKVIHPGVAESFGLEVGKLIN